MIRPVVRRADFSTLTDLAFGRLPPKETKALLKDLENDLKLSRDFEFVLALLNLKKEEWNEIRKPHSTR